MLSYIFIWLNEDNCLYLIYFDSTLSSQGHAASNPFSYHSSYTIKLTGMGCFCRNIGLELYYYTIHKTTACIITFFNDNCKQWFAWGYFPKKTVLVLWMILVAGYVNILLIQWYSTMLWGFSVLCIFMCYIHCVYTEISSQNICPWYGSYIIQYEMRMDDCLKSDICPNLPFSQWSSGKVFFEGVRLK